MKKILVIEDNFDVRENIVELLQLSGYTVLDAENGRIGVQKALLDHPDLILCDVMMPELDGFGVLHILEKTPQTANIPFIFLTAKTENSDRRKGMNLGADDYITKPYDELELLEAVEMRLKKREKIQSSFDGTPEGLNSFFNLAKGQKDLEELSDNRELRRFMKKQTIYEEGQYPKQLYFIASGKVKTFKTNDLGKEYITTVYKKGDFLGHQALISGRSYEESAMALEDVEISIIPKDDFFSLLYNNRNFSGQFIKMLAANVLEKEGQLLSLAYNSIRKRVAEALIELDKKYKAEEGIGLMREDLANIVGTAKETLIRTLTDFKNERLIEVQGRKIMIVNKKKLEDLPN